MSLLEHYNKHFGVEGFGEINFRFEGYKSSISTFHDTSAHLLQF